MPPGCSIATREVSGQQVQRRGLENTLVSLDDMISVREARFRAS